MPFVVWNSCLPVLPACLAGWDNARAVLDRAVLATCRGFPNRILPSCLQPSCQMAPRILRSWRKTTRKFR